MLNHSRAGSRLAQPSKWLDVQTNQKLAQTTQSQLMTLCDLKNDDYYKLVLAEISEDKTKTKSKLKVFKGIGMVSEHSLPGIPTSLVSFYTEEATPKTPIIAASIGSSVLLYRNMKPYYKYTLPSLPIDPLEEELWRKLPIQLPDNQGGLIEQLKTIPFAELTPQSQKLLEITQAERDDFIKQHAEEKLQRLPNITAMSTIFRNTSDSKPPSCLVLATDNGDVFIVDPILFRIIYHAKIYTNDVPPSLISVSGLLETDFIIVVATLDGCIYLLRKAWEEGREIVQTESSIINLILLPIDQTIVAATEDQELNCYSKKGKQLWTIELETNAKCMISVGLSHLGITLIGVALTNQKIQFYLQTTLVNEIKVKDNASAMIFGRLGQEDHVLSLVTIKGDLLVKILKRTAEFKDEIKPKTPENQRRVKKQRKAAKFMVQAIKDKEIAIASFNSNQAELWNFRLTVARAAIESINSAESSIAGGPNSAQIKLAAEVCGVGPEFRLFLTLENMSTDREAPNLRVLLHADCRHYRLPKPTATLPILEAGMAMEIDFEVVAVLDPTTHLPPPTLSEDNSIVRVIIFKTGQAKPLIAAIVVMPASEAPLEV